MAFEITIDNITTPVSEGETMIVDYTVLNSGGATETQTIELHIVSQTAAGIIDSFEDGDISEYSGATADFTVSDQANVTPNAIDGSMLLESLSQGEINSTSGLANYFSKGEIAHVYCYGAGLVTNAKTSYTFWGSSDTALDGYSLQFRESAGANVRLLEWTSGTAGALDTANPTLADDTWYRFEITWDDGSLGGVDNDITVDIYDDTETLIATVSGNDATHATNTGIGFRSAEAGWFWDYYHKP